MEDKDKRKGGRPLKKVKRSNDLRIRLTDIEKFLIESKARQARVSISDWFRKAAKNAKVVSRLGPEEMQVFRMLAGMANNLNQLTKLAHQQGLLSVQLKCRNLLERINLLMANLDEKR